MVQRYCEDIDKYEINKEARVYPCALMHYETVLQYETQYILLGKRTHLTKIINVLNFVQHFLWQLKLKLCVRESLAQAPYNIFCSFCIHLLTCLHPGEPRSNEKWSPF